MSKLKLTSSTNLNEEKEAILPALVRATSAGFLCFLFLYLLCSSELLCWTQIQISDFYNTAPL